MNLLDYSEAKTDNND